MDRRVRGRLAMMMGLIYAIQGSWWPLLAVHLQDVGISGRGVGWIFAAYPIGCVLAPLVVGQLADRRVASQRLLAIMYAVGTVLLIVFACGPSERPATLFVLFLAYWIVVAPSYPLAASLALRNLPRPAQQFGGVRLYGTIGWMAIGWVVTAILALSGSTRTGQGTYEAFCVAAALSAVFAGYCLTLPNTPPLAIGHRPVLVWSEAAGLLAKRPVAIFLFTAFGVSLTTPFVYQTVPPYLQELGLRRAWIGSAMTLGQVPEIASLAMLPWLLRRIGQRGTLALGVAAWCVYYGVLAARPPLFLALMAIPLNGVAIACFVVAGQMFLDSEAPGDRRATVQGLYTVVTSGVGAMLGNLLAGEMVSWNRGVVGPAVFVLPAVMNGSLAVTMLLAFRSKAVAAPEAVAKPHRVEGRLGGSALAGR